MYCCINCFSDPYIIKKFESITTDVGDCEYCSGEEVLVLDILSLQDEFHKLAQYYATTEPYQHFHPEIHGDPSDFGDSLITLINEDWEIFSDEIVGTGTDEKLLFDILNFGARDPIDVYEKHELYSRMTSDFTFVHPLENWNEHWNEFKQNLKHKNRFFPMKQSDRFMEYIKLVIGAKSIDLDKGSVIYRSRSGEWEKKNMLAPPDELASSGRTNPRGISYLYGASDVETSVAEIRPWKGAEITVVSLQVSEECSIVDLSSGYFSPFSFDSPMSALIVEKMLTGFAQELSQPVDPNKSELEYLPTQYITELIKSHGYDGILFKSSLGDGKNIVLFDESVVEVIEVSYKSITGISYNIM
ncbi:RES family NAD+ phosphorylase [Virgibacillus sp. DJP39]|uniref:RES family NAD+ phosphorylase n=1 Tax=Virgibacillus sp. DJP39 TaxID=3409790 RepID=UPI003BB732CE